VNGCAEAPDGCEKRSSGGLRRVRLLDLSRQFVWHASLFCGALKVQVCSQGTVGCEPTGSVEAGWKGAAQRRVIEKEGLSPVLGSFGKKGWEGRVGLAEEGRPQFSDSWSVMVVAIWVWVADLASPQVRAYRRGGAVGLQSADNAGRKCCDSKRFARFGGAARPGKKRSRTAANTG
jgi:hypothetical protein